MVLSIEDPDAGMFFGHVKCGVWLYDPTISFGRALGLELDESLHDGGGVVVRDSHRVNHGQISNQHAPQLIQVMKYKSSLGVASRTFLTVVAQRAVADGTGVRMELDVELYGPAADREGVEQLLEKLETGMECVRHPGTLLTMPTQQETTHSKTQEVHEKSQ
jgi:hypothetical protein